jgi:CRISPR-associated endonuclease Cas1
LRFFPGDAKLPSRIIALDCDGAITFDVIQWLSRQAVPFIVLSWQGDVVSVLGQQGPYDPVLRQTQLEAMHDGRGLELARRLICDKIRGCQETLLAFRNTQERAAALGKLEVGLAELETMPATIEEVRIIEARAALAYFTHWQELQLHWKGTGRKPIPPEWHRVGLRKGLLSGGNRHATHPVNALLNYAYAALESQVRIAVVAHGLDPTIGYLHASYPNRLALVYDLMEPLRPQVDRLVLDFVRANTFSPTDFVLTPTGVCRLHPQLARRIAGLTVVTGSLESVMELMLSRLHWGHPSATRAKHGGLKGSRMVRRGRPSRPISAGPKTT